MSYKITRNEEYRAAMKSMPEDVQHWKYVKKKKVNGKWRYYYDIKDALGYDERQKAAQADYEYKRAIDAEKGYAGISSKPEQVKWYDEDKHKSLIKAKVDAGKKASKAMEKYYNTPLGKIDQIDDVIDEGRKKISKFFKNLAKKIMPKDESKSFSKYR